MPAVEATWWAGGIRVSEHIAAISGTQAFRRSIRLAGAHLSGEETVKLRLALPPGQWQRHGDILLQSGRGACLALAVLGGPQAAGRGRGEPGDDRNRPARAWPQGRNPR